MTTTMKNDPLLPESRETDVGSLSTLALAHVGDAVYELLVRTLVCSGGSMAVERLHKRTVAMVKAEAQAKAAERIVPLLNEEEQLIFKRGRNAHVNSVPKSAELSDYHAATGLEALFGWLYLNGRDARLRELFDAICVTEAGDAT